VRYLHSAWRLTTSGDEAGEDGAAGDEGVDGSEGRVGAEKASVARVVRMSRGLGSVIAN
jgi:hypothetical protein